MTILQHWFFQFVDSSRGCFTPEVSVPEPMLTCWRDLEHVPVITVATFEQRGPANGLSRWIKGGQKVFQVALESSFCGSDLAWWCQPGTMLMSHDSGLNCSQDSSPTGIDFSVMEPNHQAFYAFVSWIEWSLPQTSVQCFHKTIDIFLNVFLFSVVLRHSWCFPNIFMTESIFVTIDHPFLQHFHNLCCATQILWLKIWNIEALSKWSTICSTAHVNFPKTFCWPVCVTFQILNFIIWLCSFLFKMSSPNDKAQWLKPRVENFVPQHFQAFCSEGRKVQPLHTATKTHHMFALLQQFLVSSQINCSQMTPVVQWLEIWQIKTQFVPIKDDVLEELCFCQNDSSSTLLVVSSSESRCHETIEIEPQSNWLTLVNEIQSFGSLA